MRKFNTFEEREEQENRITYIVITSTKVRVVEDDRVESARLVNVARLIAFARIEVGKISDGINQAPGPIPKLKDEK